MLPRIVGLLLALLGASALAAPPVFDLYIPDAMPLAAPNDPLGHGLVGDAVLEAAALAGYRVNIVSEPWLRAQKRVREGKNLLILPLSRTPGRETQYTWIASVLPLPRAFFTFSQPLQNFEQARTEYKRIGVGIGSAQEEILLSQGFSREQIYPLQLGDKPLRLLELKRIDAWFTTVPEGQFAWNRNTRDPLLMSPEMATTEMYLACSKTCDATVIKRMRAAIAKLRANGGVERIRERYMNPPTK